MKNLNLTELILLIIMQMTDVHNNFIEAIGNTPLIRLNGPSIETGCNILGKAEYLNPGGSIKDRAAWAIIKDSEEKNILRENGIIVEGTAGNTGIGLTLIGNSKGYKSIIVMPDTQTKEKIDILRYIGAELRLVPDERRIAEIGWDRSIVASLIQTFGDGKFVGDYFNGEETLDVILRATSWNTPESLASIPIVTSDNQVLPLSEFVNVVRTVGPEEIRRVNRRRTVTLEVSPPPNVSLEEALTVIKRDVEPKILEQLPDNGNIYYAGTADKLTTALESMKGSFLLAITILYLLMSAMFRSFRDSLLVMLAIPLATFGGILALNLMNLVSFQPMDLLTMIGFIILLGLVVNNAILLVYQARIAEREGRTRKNAVEEAILLRLRPIMMSTLTSIFGMLPLIIIPGAGTELYRGLAGVIVGGMIVSTLFTLILLPSLLRIGEDKVAAQ